MTVKVAEGIRKRGFFKEETAYDTWLAIAATDAVPYLDLKLQPNYPFEEVQEAVGTASLQELIGQKKMGKWTSVHTLRPAAAGTPPDIGVILKAIMGVETITGGTKVEYTLSDSVRTSLKIVEHVPDALYQSGAGAWVESMDIEAQGNQIPKISFAGGYATHIWAYGALVGTGGAANNDTVIPFNSAMDANVSIDAVVKIGTSDGAGAGHRVTAVDWTANTITVSPGITGAQAEGVAIVPFTPSQTLGGTVQGGVEHGLTIDGVTLGFISAKISLASGLHSLDKEATATRPNRMAGAARRVTGEFQVYFLDETNGTFFGRAWDGVRRDIALRLGPNTAAKRLKIDIDKAHLFVTPKEVPESEETLATIKFTALQNAAATDEMKLTFD